MTCGPEGTPDILSSKFFHKACSLHDDDYAAAYRPRKEVDLEFLNRMLKKAEDNKLRVAHAYLYYYLVRIFGWIRYGR